MVYKNVFVLSTGRCGSTTFTKACTHFSNYTSGHETLSKYLGDDRFSYPSRHIESDNRLSWLLGRLDRAYGDSAFYVHLTREPEKVAASFAKRKRGIILAYQGKGIIMGCVEDDQYKIALDYIETVNENIRLFLKDKSKKMRFRLEAASDDFGVFYDRIGAEGDFGAAIKEFEFSHNATRSDDERKKGLSLRGRKRTWFNRGRKMP